MFYMELRGTEARPFLLRSGGWLSGALVCKFLRLALRPMSPMYPHKENWRGDTATFEACV